MGRVIPGLAMAAAWLLLLLFSPFRLFWLVAVIFSVIGLFEYFRMTQSKPQPLLRLLLITLSSFPVLAAYFATAEAVTAGLVASFLSLVFLVLYNHGRSDDILRFFSLGSLGILYIALCAAHLVLLFAGENGGYWLVILSCITAGSDTGAYYSGRAFGKGKLCPGISPGKTVEGAVGGVAAGVLAAVLVSFLLPVQPSLSVLALVAAALVVIGICGDLTESVIKRAVGVKDSSALLGAHGGLLDRVDSLLLTAPVLYYLLRFGVLS